MKISKLLSMCLFSSFCLFLSAQNQNLTEEYISSMPKGHYYVIVDAISRNILSTIDINKMNENLSGFQVISEFTDERALFKTGDAKEEIYKYGFIGTNGEIAIQPKYTKARPFASGFAAVYVRDKKGSYSWNFIDTKGNVLSPIGFADVDDFVNDYAVVHEIGTYNSGVIDKTGKMIIPFSENELSGNSEGRFVFKDSEKTKYGYINVNNRIVVPAKYSYASAFSDGMAYVVIDDDEFGFIDETGKLKIKLDTQLYRDNYSEWPKNYYGRYLGSYKNGYCRVYDPIEKKWGFIDKDGNWMFDQLFANVKDYSNGIAMVSPENTNFIIDWVYWIDDKGKKIDLTDDRLKEEFVFGDGGDKIVNGKNELISGSRDVVAFGEGPREFYIDNGLKSIMLIEIGN